MRSRDGHAEILLELEQLRDGREEQMQKTAALKQSVRTMKAELVHRENITVALKR